jgi:hypothetical protein
MTLGAAMKEARPSLSRIVQSVQPKVILMETMKPEVFSKLYCGGELGRLIREPLMATHRGRSVRAFQAMLMPVTCLRRSIPVVAIGHPSSTSFSTGQVWSAITSAVRSVCEDFGACCRWIRQFAGIVKLRVRLSRSLAALSPLRRSCMRSVRKLP